MHWLPLHSQPQWSGRLWNKNIEIDTCSVLPIFCPKTRFYRFFGLESCFFAVQDSSMEDIVTQSDSHLLFYMLNYCEAIRGKDQNIAKGTTDPKNCIYTEGIGFLER